MSLPRLPPELLLQVIECLGASFFRDDIRRLTVCKTWYYCARKVFWAEVKLSAKGLKRLLVSPTVTKHSDLFKFNLKSLALEVTGFDEWETSPPGEYLPLTEDVSANVVLGDCHPRLLEWTTQLDDAILKLSELLRGCSSLRILNFTAFREHHPLFPYLPFRDYLYANTLSHVLSLQNITVLELDTCGSSFLSEEEPHICSYIGPLLSQLHCLRLRMREICPAALRPSEGSKPTLLKDVIVNLSLTDDASCLTAMTYPRRCGLAGAGGFSHLRSDIKEQAELLLSQMENPRTVRILYQIFPSLDLRSFNVMTGKIMTLADDMAWEDDGDTEEGDPEDSDE